MNPEPHRCDAEVLATTPSHLLLLPLQHYVWSISLWSPSSMTHECGNHQAKVLGWKKDKLNVPSNQWKVADDIMKLREQSAYLSSVFVSRCKGQTKHSDVIKAKCATGITQALYYCDTFLKQSSNYVMKQKVRSLTLRWLMSYIYGAPILDVSRSHTTTQHSR